MKPPARLDLESVMNEYSEKFDHLSSEFKIDLNEFIKSTIKEVDIFSRKVGITPQLSEGHVGFSPIAIFREPTINEFFLNPK